METGRAPASSHVSGVALLFCLSPGCCQQNLPCSKYLLLDGTVICLPRTCCRLLQVCYSRLGTSSQSGHGSSLCICVSSYAWIRAWAGA